MTVRSAPFSHRRGDGAVGVFHQFSCAPGVAKAGIDRDVGIHAEQTAEREELIGAHVVRLNGVPNRIVDGRALVRIADRITPLVRGDEVAAGEAIDAGVQLLERGNHFRAEALDVVGRHQRDRSDVKRARAGSGDFELRIVAVALGPEVQRERPVRGAEGANGQHLTLTCLAAPRQSLPSRRRRGCRPARCDPCTPSPCARQDRFAGLHAPRRR